MANAAFPTAQPRQASIRPWSPMGVRHLQRQVRAEGVSTPSRATGWHHETVAIDEQTIIDALRRAGARFAFVHGSRTGGGTARPDSDLDVGAWWADDPPAAWDVTLPSRVDLVVLNEAPLWLAGRIAQHGRLLFDDDRRARVRWQADTRLQYVDEIPYIRERYRQRREQLARGVNNG